jgi:hypothetical protein
MQTQLTLEGHVKKKKKKKRVIHIILQWTPHNGITLGQALTEPFNQMITITKYISYAKYATERHFELDESDPINHTIPLTLISLSRSHCSTCK